jgi:hypothetical protein
MVLPALAIEMAAVPSFCGVTAPATAAVKLAPPS